MNSEEVATVLARVQVGDNREVDVAVLEDWVDLIGRLDFDVALEAVRMHRRESTEYLTATHVLANARRIVRAWERDERISEQFARRALPAPQITLDRAEFERLTQEAIVAERARKAAEHE